MSLNSKLRTFKRAICRKHKPHLALDDNQTRLIIRHMPQNDDELRTKCAMDECQLKASGNQLLEMTRIHDRDQDKFETCIQEMRAFADGGLVGMLNRVWLRIVETYGVTAEKYDALPYAGVGVKADDGVLFRKRSLVDDETPLVVPETALFKRRYAHAPHAPGTRAAQRGQHGADALRSDGDLSNEGRPRARGGIRHGFCTLFLAALLPNVRFDGIDITKRHVDLARFGSLQVQSLSNTLIR